MKSIYLIAALYLFIAPSSKAETSLADLQAMYIYNFLRYVQWPTDAVKDSYVIGVNGNSEVFEALKKYTANREVGGKKITVIKCSDSYDLLKCNVLFISKEKCNCLKQINDQLKGRNCLTIFENCNKAKSCTTIDLFYENNTLKYKVNEEMALAQNLIISNVLVKMAI